MSKFTPFEKLSGKAKKEIAKKKRVAWGSLNPVTRRPENPKAYKRKKIRNWEDDYSTDLYSIFIDIVVI